MTFWKPPHWLHLLTENEDDDYDTNELENYESISQRVNDREDRIAALELRVRAIELRMKAQDAALARYRQSS